MNRTRIGANGGNGVHATAKFDAVVIGAGVASRRTMCLSRGRRRSKARCFIRRDGRSNRSILLASVWAWSVSE